MYMNKITILLVGLFIVSCDPLFHDDFIIVNNCDDDVNISVIHQNGDEQLFDVRSHSEIIFFSDEWVGGKSNSEKINIIFKIITVTKDNIVSKINYVDSSLWRKENVEDSRRNKYYINVKYYLTIYPEDFKNE